MKDPDNLSKASKNACNRFGPRKTNSEVFVENSQYPRHRLKERIIKQNLLEWECSICGMLPEWNGKKLMLVLDHINGVNNDNRIENLRFVCPNCNSQLPTHCAKNIKHASLVERHTHYA